MKVYERYHQAMNGSDEVCSILEIFSVRNGTYLDSGLSNLNVNTHEVFIRIKLSKDEVEVEEDEEETEETVESSD